MTTRKPAFKINPQEYDAFLYVMNLGQRVLEKNKMKKHRKKTDFEKECQDPGLLAEWVTERVAQYVEVSK